MKVPNRKYQRLIHFIFDLELFTKQHKRGIYCMLYIVFICNLCIRKRENQEECFSFLILLKGKISTRLENFNLRSNTINSEF